MPSREVQKLLRDIATDSVAPVHYSRKTLSARVVLLVVILLRTVLNTR